MQGGSKCSCCIFGRSKTHVSLGKKNTKSSCHILGWSDSAFFFLPLHQMLIRKDACKTVGIWFFYKEWFLQEPRPPIPRGHQTIVWSTPTPNPWYLPTTVLRERWQLCPGSTVMQITLGGKASHASLGLITPFLVWELGKNCKDTNLLRMLRILLYNYGVTWGGMLKSKGKERAGAEGRSTWDSPCFSHCLAQAREWVFVYNSY